MVLPSFVKCSNEMAVRTLFKTNGRVASMEYTKKCKLFIFPREEVRAEWLDIINFVVVKTPEIQSFDLLCFIVAKLSEDTYELGIEPEKLHVNSAC